MMEQTKAIIQAIYVVLAIYTQSSYPIISYNGDGYRSQRKGIAEDVAHAEPLAVVVTF